MYSNSCGYLGGVSWTILCGRICQMFPNAPLPYIYYIIFSALIYNFFAIYLQWPWPEPICLCDIEYLGKYDNLVWHSGLNHVMPILLPTYPAQNTAVNVCMASFNNIIMEFYRTYNVLHKNALINQIKWDKIIKKSAFFRGFPYYLIYNMQAYDKNDLPSWFYYCQTRSRRLLDKISVVDGIKNVNLLCITFDVDDAVYLYIL